MSSASNQKSFRDLLPHGSQKKIADELGITRQSVSEALKNGKPSHPAVMAALKIIERSGSAKAARSIQKLAQ